MRKLTLSEAIEESREEIRKLLVDNPDMRRRPDLVRDALRSGIQWSVLPWPDEKVEAVVDAICEGLPFLGLADAG